MKFQSTCIYTILLEIIISYKSNFHLKFYVFGADAVTFCFYYYFSNQKLYLLRKHFKRKMRENEQAKEKKKNENWKRNQQQITKQKSFLS